MAITYGISIDNDYTITNLSGGGAGGADEQIAVTVSTTGKETLENADWIQDLLNDTDLYCEISGTGTFLDNKVYYVEDITSGTVFELTVISNERPAQGAASGSVRFMKKPPVFDFSASSYQVAYDFRNSNRINNQAPSSNPNENALTQNGTINYTAAAQNLSYYESTGSSGFFEYEQGQLNMPMPTTDYTYFEMVVDIDVKVGTSRYVFDNTDGNSDNGFNFAIAGSSGSVTIEYFKASSQVILNEPTIIPSNRTSIVSKVYYDGADTVFYMTCNGQVVLDTTISGDQRIDPASIAENTVFPASSSGSIYRFIAWKKNNKDTI
ncbi:MAG: hypothetical protein ACRBG0_27745 [Lewinella sp.]|uniref:hypothetical protein n=1 Tax=Lewinella sp. TaxID=2004506 RepID=UPI003D6A9445